MAAGQFFSIGAAGSPNFATTRWTVLSLAASDRAPATKAQHAWEHLCQSYWLPLYLFVRRRDHDAEDAQDAVQDFFLHLLENRVIAQADRRRGLFRTYLLRCFCNFLANRTQRERTLKRGGGLSFVPLEDLELAESNQLAETQNWPPECAYDLGWAYVVVDTVLAKLKDEAAGRGKRQWFDELCVFLPGGSATVSGRAEDETNLYQKAAERLGVSVETLRTAVHRLRARFREAVREEVACTVETPDEVEAELRHLRSTLSLGSRNGG